jgi:hypothetical protein
MKLQESPSIVIRDTVEKVLFSPSKILLNIDLVKRNSSVCKEYMESDRG